jgi:hypothetical protein
VEAMSEYDKSTAVVHRATGDRLLLFRPGCKSAHQVSIAQGGWTWNGDYQHPTIQPSILLRDADESGETRCHSFVTDGKIQFLSDCTHHLKDQTVALEPF